MNALTLKDGKLHIVVIELGYNGYFDDPASDIKNSILIREEDQERAKKLILKNHIVDNIVVIKVGKMYPIPGLKFQKQGICCSPLAPNINHHGNCDECQGYKEQAILQEK